MTRLSRAADPSLCPEELLEKYPTRLHGLGLRGDGNPCKWKGVMCRGCNLVALISKHADGDLQYVRDMTDLKTLHLSTAPVSGDVGALENISSLMTLNLGGSKVSGDIGTLRNLRNLTTLDLSKTQVFGDVGALQSPSLHNLRLAHTKVSGDIASFQNLTGLKRLRLSETGVSGNVASLENLSLETLELAQTEVSGNCAVIGRMPSLKQLDLSDTKLSGHDGCTLKFNLAVTTPLPCSEDLLEKQRNQLHGLGVLGDGNPCQWPEVTCRGCAVVNIVAENTDGNLQSVQDMTELEGLHLFRSRTSGDIRALENLTFMKMLQVSDSLVSGDVGPLSKLTQLKRLMLSNTRVSGDIEVLSSLDLTELDLSGTQLSGNIRALETLTKMEMLFLSGTKVFGNFAVIGSMPSLKLLDVSATKVSGSLEDLPKGCCTHLTNLNVAETEVGVSHDAEFLEIPHVFFLPALLSLNVDGCSLNMTVKQLLVSLAASPISSIFASGCGLIGSVPNPREYVQRGSAWREIGAFPLFQSLQLLDLSDNSLEEATFLPSPNLDRLDISRNRRPLRLSPAVIQGATKQGSTAGVRLMDLWLTNTSLANSEDLYNLSSTDLKATESWVESQSAGFACHELARPNFQVTPEMFMPLQLCGCLPGYFGTGTNCTACPNNTFSNAMNRSTCEFCPIGSTSSIAATSLDACNCRFGSPTKIGTGYVCRCEKNEAETADHRCVPCGEWHLLCPTPGELVATAPLQQGYVRLREPSEEIFQCLDQKRCSNSTCTPGHVGPLCADCAARFRAANGLCIECKNLSSQQKTFMGLGGTGMLLILAVMAWSFRHRLPSLDHRQQCLLQLMAAQSAVLLQVTQLWTVLGRLPRAAPGSDPVNVTDVVDIEGNSTMQGGPLLSYLETLQFTGSELQNLLALQCIYDGVTVRMLFALATPVVPLLLLLLCACLEMYSRGFGIRIGLKTLTVLFIGGAGGSAQLLECQRTDAAGGPLKEFAFRPLFPHQRCDEAPWVDAVGWATAAGYGLLIPAFLGFLFMKQKLVMRKTKTVFTETTVDKGRIAVKLRGLESEKTFEEQLLGKRLAAAAAAYVANHVNGKAVVELQKDIVTVVPLARGASTVSDDLTVESLVFGGDVEEAQVLQRHATAQMLMERSILEEESDRFMLGASQLFGKYAKCENVWMEVCSKVAAAALVSEVAVGGLWLCVAITLGMALVTSLARPFAQPQLNDLQAVGFACLAVAAMGFRYWVLLANLALAVPLVLLVVQLRRPDSVEMLALRLQQELESKIHKGPVEVNAEQFA